MPRKTWTFALDGNLHTVAFDYNMLTGWERLTVDDREIFNGVRWTIVSRYPFLIGTHECVATLRSGMTDFTGELTIDGQPFELLPDQSLLRPASPENTVPDQLLRPSASSASLTSPGELLRPSRNEEDKNMVDKPDGITRNVVEG